MDRELTDFEPTDSIETTMSYVALFDQYDEPEYAEQADCCENLYPSFT